MFEPFGIYNLYDAFPCEDGTDYVSVAVSIPLTAKEVKDYENKGLIVQPVKEDVMIELVTCPVCNGQGSDNWDTDKDCQECAGRGFVPMQVGRCPNCGKAEIGNRCPDCGYVDYQ